MQRIIVQYATDRALAPKPALLRLWAKKALGEQLKETEVTIRIVDVAEMTTLNATYRHKQGPTNVLSFPFAAPEECDVGANILGDVVVCAEVVNREAVSQQKTAEAHWAHMIVHGCLHLQGFDHETDQEAKLMEDLEIKIMQNLQFANPYTTGVDIKRYD